MSRYTEQKYDLEKLKILVDARQEAELSLTQVAQFFGLGEYGYGSVTKWETGECKPRSTRRDDFIRYLVDKLGLRRNFQQFLQVWDEVMVEEWEWESLTDQELRRYFPGQTSMAAHLFPHQIASLGDVTGRESELAQLAQLIGGENTASDRSLWALTFGDDSPKHLGNGITVYPLYLIAIPMQSNRSEMQSK